jgi:hypothetical protein
MTPKTIFTLILKIIGLYLILSLAEVLSAAFSSLPVLMMQNSPIDAPGFWVSSIIILVLLFYFYIIRLLLFRTAWVIDRLSLDKHFEEEIVVVKFDSASVLQIATIILGGILFTGAIPTLCQEIINWLQQTQAEPYLTRHPSFAYMVFDGCKLLLGYLLLTNSKQVTNWIEQKNGKFIEIEEDTPEANNE